MILTDVVFTFYDIQGEPIAETPFTIQLVRSGFAHQTGVVLPEAIEVVTDAFGKATVALAPSSTPYYVTIDSMGHCGKQSYRFFVPESDVPLNFQDLIAIDELDPAVITEEKIRLIIEASAISKESAANSKISETNAKLSETNAKASEIAAIDAANSVAGALEAAAASAAAAKISEDAAKLSEASTAMSEQTANASAIAARASEVNAKASEDSAAFSALSSSQDASTATQKAQEAVVSASNAKTSEDNAAASDVRVTALKGEVETTYQQNVIVKAEVQALLDQALAVGSGWSPVIKAVQDGADRCVLQIVDWTGGVGVKPAVGYIGLTGVVPTAGEAVNIQGANGADGSSFTVNATGPFSERSLHDNEQAGFAFLSTDTGLLYIREGAAGGWSAGIPFGKGDKGDKGERGEQGIQGLPGKDSTIPGPANTLSIGTVTTGPISAATITGQSPNQVLNLTLQPGPKGEQGIQGQGWSQAQTDKLNGIEAQATKNESLSIAATSMVDFFTQCLAKGSGFYRADGDTIPGELRYSAGFFSKAQDTWSFTTNKYDSGRPVFYAGRFGDIPTATWKVYDPMERSNHTGVQAISTISGLQAALDAKVSSEAGKSLMSDAEHTKLGTVATNASANSSDAFLLNRANHSGSQAIGTVSGLTDALRGMRNKIINGGFQINQRAYVSGAATSAGQYTLDRWKVTGVGGVTFSTVENKCTVTIPAGQTLQQVIEGLNLQTGNYVLSWEGTAKGRVGSGAYGNSGAVTVAIVGGTNTTIEFNAGTVSNVQFETGVVVTPFEHRFIGAELALCKRYYEIGFLSVCSDGIVAYARAITQMSETKRATPTFIAMDNAGNFGKCSADAENNIPAQVSGSANFVAFNVNNAVKSPNVFFNCNWFAIAEL